MEAPADTFGQNCNRHCNRSVAWAFCSWVPRSKSRSRTSCMPAASTGAIAGKKVTGGRGGDERELSCLIP